MLARTIRLLLALLLCALPVAAQEHPNWSRGFGSQSTFDLTDFDSVNTFNGNLNVRIPIGFPYPVSGALSYGLTLHYSGNNWRHSRTYSDPWGNPYIDAHMSDDWNAGFGWLLSLGRIAIPPGWSSLAYQSPDGNWHALYDTLHQYDPQDAGDPGMQWAYTRDGSYLRVKMVPGQPWEVQFPDGAVHKFYSNGQIFAMTDRFGNTVNIDVLDPNTIYTPHPNTEWPANKSWRITDGHGRTHYVHFRPNMYGQEVVGKVDLSGPGGTRAIYRFNYDYATFSHPCTGNPDPNVPQYTTMAVLRSVELPDGSTYADMQYDNGDGGYNCSNPNLGSFSGTLKSMRLPARGKVEWIYREYEFPGNSESDPYYSFHASGVVTRRLVRADGAITDVRTYDGPAPGQHLVGTGLYPPQATYNIVTAREPNGTVIYREKHYFSVDMYASGGTTRGWYGLPMSRVERAAATNVAPNTDGSTPGRYLSAEIFDANGTLLRAIYRRFEGDDDLWVTGEVNQRLVSDNTIYFDDTTCTGGTCYASSDYSSFDGLGHYRQTQSSGNFRGAAETRTTFTNFNPDRGTFVPTHYPASYTMLPASSPWVLNTFPEQTVTEGSSTQKAQFCFDANTGFLRRKRLLAGSSPGANDLLTVFTPDSAGNLLREESYGGDVQSLGTTDLCTLTLPANQYRVDHSYQYGVRHASQVYDAAGTALSFKTIDYDVDSYSGLIATSRDSAGLVTTYEYDAMGRPTWIKPAQAGWTQYAYVPATQAAAGYLHTRNWSNGGGSLLAQSLVEVDGFGRTWRENTMSPDGTWSVKETLYNGAGWVSAVSEPRQYGGTSGWTYFQNYDPFGRARTIVPPDGSAHSVTMTFAGDRIATKTLKVGTSRDGSGNIVETSVSRTERRDRYGRLWQVTEPSGPGGANVTTTYSYDAGGRMTQSVTAAPEATQTRTFVYDGRGLLLSQAIPEKATATTFGNYDAAGNVGRRSNDAAGVFDILYTYDRAGRVTQVRSSRNGTVKLLKEFTYAVANGTVDGVTDYRNGKLASAVRHNWFGTHDSPVTENYFYGGKQGAVSRRTTISAVGASFTQTFTVNDLGARAMTTYPSCLHGCPGEPARTVTFNYSWGRLGAVVGYAPSIAYHPNGMVSQVTHANGVTWNQTIASTNMTRPASIYTTGALNGSGGAADWNSGAYVYDGAGNIVKTGADYFLYDGVSRLIEGTADNNGGATRRQTQAFDSFGNITSFTTNGTVRSTGAVATTNRLSTHAYDGNGNATSHLSDTYGWDDLDAMMTLSPSTKGWHYLYTADDERIGRYNHLSAFMSWYVRDLDGKVLREYVHNNWRSDGSLGAGTWSWVKDYVYRDGTLLATVDAAGTRHFHPDHLGTPRLITDSGRVARSRNDYYPFGQEATSILQNAPNAEERMKFTGHERDLNGPSGTENLDYLDYMHARYYNPAMGRFLSVDAAGADPAAPQSWNRYVYVLGNPQAYVDPDGYESARKNKDMGTMYEFIEVVAPAPPPPVFSMSITVTASAPGGMTIPSGVMGLLMAASQTGGGYSNSRLLHGGGGPAAADPARPLSPTAQKQLQPNFPNVDLSKVSIRENAWWLLPGWGMTVGDTIFYSGRFPDGPRPNWSFISHELAHVEQFREHGMLWFYDRYTSDAFKHGFSHDNIPFERKADERATAIMSGPKKPGRRP